MSNYQQRGGGGGGRGLGRGGQGGGGGGYGGQGGGQRGGGGGGGYHQGGQGGQRGGGGYQRGHGGGAYGGQGGQQGGHRGGGGGGGQVYGGQRQEYGGGGGDRGGRGGGFRGGPRGGGGGGFRGGRGRDDRMDQLAEHLRNFELDPFVKGVDNIQRNWVGKAGTTLSSIITNFFRVPKIDVKLLKNLKVYRVDIKRQDTDKEGKVINKLMEKRELCRELFWIFVERFQENFKSRYYVFDDSHKMYSMIELDFGKLNMELTPADEIVQTGQTNPGHFILEIKATKEEINILNVANLLLTQHARCPLGNIRHVYCDRDRIYNIYRNPVPNVDYLDLEAIQFLKGIRAIMKQGPGAYLANYDVCHSAFSKIKVDILEFYALVKHVKLTDVLRQQMQNYGLNDGQRRELKSLLNGLNLKTKDGFRWDPRYYKCTEITNVTPANKVINWKKEDGTVEKVSVQAYYKKRYDYTIKYPNMPLIQCGPKEKNLTFPIEVLTISDRLQRIRQKLPEYLQASCTTFSTKAPDLRFKDISRMLKESEFTTAGGSITMNDPFLNQFGIQIDHRLMEIDGRILPKPMTEEILSRQKQDVRLKPVVFSLLAIGDRYSDTDRTIILENVNKVIVGCRLRKMNVEGQEPYEKNIKTVNEIGDPSFDEFLKGRMERAKREYPGALLVLIVVVPEANDFVYNTVKQKCELDLRPNVGVMSQFLKLETLRIKVGDQRNPDPGRNRVVDNIVRKINAKAGGINIKISQKFPTWFTYTNPDKPTLFIGIDVTHPSPGEEDMPSIAAVVGNIDLDGVKYGASVRRQERLKNDKNIAQEPVKHMVELVDLRLKAFYAHTQKWPARIIIFRDGVSESQFEMVRFDECVAAKAGCLKAMKDLNIPTNRCPLFAIVVVQKRHSTRFWAKGCDRPDAKHENVPPGTVVEKYITNEPIKGIDYEGENLGNRAYGCDKKDNRCEKEFYLCSHQGLLGTSRPGRYNVIYDEINLSADDVQQLAYALCYLYAPTSMPVSIPAPVYYAHKACYRARKHYASLRNQKIDAKVIRDEKIVQVHDELANKMYFC